MTALVVYGSLMAKAEISALGLNPEMAIPVIIQGYQRIFAQEPSWRKGVGNERAVLTVVRSPQAEANQSPSFSGILLPNISAEIIKELDVRERGYNREHIEESKISPFEIEVTWKATSAQIYVGKPHLFNKDIVPNSQYQKRCLDAALEWGSAFYQSFLNTTQKLQIIPS